MAVGWDKKKHERVVRQGDRKKNWQGLGSNKIVLLIKKLDATRKDKKI